MTHYHVITDCQQMQVPPFMTDDMVAAVDQYNGTIEAICGSTGAELRYQHNRKKSMYLSDGSTVRLVICNKDCLIKLTYDPAAEERKRKEELAAMPKEDERGYCE